MNEFWKDSSIIGMDNLKFSSFHDEELGIILTSSAGSVLGEKNVNGDGNNTAICICLNIKLIVKTANKKTQIKF